jgi:uncharacterized membrane protein
MSARTSRALALSVFVLALAFHLAIAWQDFSTLARNGFLYDDSFYAFKIAQNIAAGNGITFDGVTPTNGFQPLYVFMLVPVFFFLGNDLVTPVYVALSLSAILAALTAALLYFIARRYVSERLAAATALVWAFSPVVIRQSANGLETALATLFFASVIYVYLSRIRSQPAPRNRDFWLLGVLIGLSVLGRIDQAFLALAIAIDYFLLARRGEVHARGGQIVRAVVAAFIVYSPWLSYNVFVMGHVFQDSGAATRFLSVVYAPFFGLGPAGMADRGPDAGFLWTHLVHAFSVLKVSPPFHAFFRAIERIGLAAGTETLATVASSVLGLLLIVAFLLVALRVRGNRTPVGELRFLLLVALLFVGAYSLYVFGVFFFIRYLYPLYIIVCLYAAVLVSELAHRLDLRRPALRGAVAAGVAAYVLTFGYMAFTAAFRSTPLYCFYDVAGWLNEHTSQQETIGVFQGGAIGYFVDRRVVNLDGKVNRAALEALQSNRIADYMKRQGIDVLVDNARVLHLVFGEGGAPARIAGCDQIMYGGRDGLPGWVAYRLHGNLGDVSNISVPPSGHQ